jgi:hypothetical protein
MNWWVSQAKATRQVVITLASQEVREIFDIQYDGRSTVFSFTANEKITENQY